MVEQFLIFRSEDSKLQTQIILEHIPFFECASCWKNLHITWIKEKDNITNLKNLMILTIFHWGESLQPQSGPWDSEGLPNFNNLPTWFHNGKWGWNMVGGGVWMDVYLPHLWCYNFSRFLRLNSSSSNKKSVGEKIQICGFFWSHENVTSQHGTSSKKETKQKTNGCLWRIQTQIPNFWHFVGLPFENPTGDPT